MNRIDTAIEVGPLADPLHDALLDSRQRWRALVSMAADLAFETDSWGRFTLIAPDPALGWSAGLLTGQPASLLLTDSADGTSFDPFRPTVPVRRRRAWVRRADGSSACLTFAAMPILDADGHIRGARGVGIDMTEYDDQSASVAAALRRGELLEHILSCVNQEILAPRMMEAALDALLNAVGAEGAGVLRLPEPPDVPGFAHRAGRGADSVIDCAIRMLNEQPRLLSVGGNFDGRQLLAIGCQTRFGARAGLIAWRAADGRPWDGDDRTLIGAGANVIRIVLEHEAIQREMTLQARTDPLTGLLNRRAFLEEAERHCDRLSREELPGTLMFVDLDNFKAVNDRLGHEMGDRVLLRTTELLRLTFRPSDLIARLGGDEFAIWLSGADHLTAAERAERLRENAPSALADLVGGDGPKVGMSIGIASRHGRSREGIDSLMRRADMAMYEVKRSGRGHWRVSLIEADHANG